MGINFSSLFWVGGLTGMLASVVCALALEQCQPRVVIHQQGVCDQACHARARVLDPDPLKCLCPNDHVLVVKAGGK